MKVYLIETDYVNDDEWRVDTDQPAFGSQADAIEFVYNLNAKETQASQAQDAESYLTAHKQWESRKADYEALKAAGLRKGEFTQWEPQPDSYKYAYANRPLYRVCDQAVEVRLSTEG